MPQRVATARIVVGTENEQKTVEPGTRFSTDEYGMSAEDVARYDADGVMREPRDEQKPDANDPRMQSELGEVVENRSERATEVTGEYSDNRKPEQQRPTGPATVERGENAENRTPAASDRGADRTRTRRDHDL